jgi:signal transduction histidine kinase
VTAFSGTRSRFSYLTLLPAVGLNGAKSNPLFGGGMESSTDPQAGGRRLAALGDAENLIDRLHAEAEAHRSALAREIHDDLGGLMVSAAMDLTSVRRGLPDIDASILKQLDRGKKTLQSAIDLSRRMVEELRPSILDNFGLFAALKWHLKKASEGSSVQLTESYPASEPTFQPAASTALFRVAQEAIAMIFNRKSVAAAEVNFQVEDGRVLMRFTDDGIPHLVDGQEVGAVSALTSMKHRIRALGGTVELRRNNSGGSELTACMPLPELPPPAQGAG